MFSCENNETFDSILKSNDIEKIKLTRKTIVASQQDLNGKIEQLDNRIENKRKSSVTNSGSGECTPSKFDHYTSSRKC